MPIYDSHIYFFLENTPKLSVFFSDILSSFSPGKRPPSLFFIIKSSIFLLGNFYLNLAEIFLGAS